MVCPVTGHVRKVHEPHQNDCVGTLFFMLFLKKSVFALCRAHSVGANHGATSFRRPKNMVATATEVSGRENGGCRRRAGCNIHALCSCRELRGVRSVIFCST